MVFSFLLTRSLVRIGTLERHDSFSQIGTRRMVDSFLMSDAISSHDSSIDGMFGDARSASMELFLNVDSLV